MVKYVVELLLVGDGLLGELFVWLKLVYVLGVIIWYEYEDVELLMVLCEELNYDGIEYCFIDDEIFGLFGELYCVVELLLVLIFLCLDEVDVLLIVM